MSMPAVEFESVSKRYVIRHQRTSYLKDRLKKHAEAVPGSPTIIHVYVAPLNPSKLRPSGFERLDTKLCFLVIWRKPHQYANSA